MGLITTMMDILGLAVACLLTTVMIKMRQFIRELLKSVTVRTITVTDKQMKASILEGSALPEQARVKETGRWSVLGMELELLAARPLARRLLKSVTT